MWTGGREAPLVACGLVRLCTSGGRTCVILSFNDVMNIKAHVDSALKALGA